MNTAKTPQVAGVELDDLVEAGRKLKRLDPERFALLLELARAYVATYDSPCEDDEPFSARLPLAKRIIRGDGPLESFDRELVGFVCSKSNELGCGFELYEEVADLDRSDRAQLRAALEPLTNFDAYGDITGTAEEISSYQAEWCRVCEELGCSDALADAFILTRESWVDTYVHKQSYDFAAADSAGMQSAGMQS